MIRCMRTLILVLALSAATGSACGGDDEPTAASSVSNITTLQITDTKTGTGAEAVAGRQVTVHYTGWLYNANATDHRGRQFDTSRDDNVPLTFPLGAGRVIRGWDQGVVGMKVGGTRTLIIPPDLAYGAQGFTDRIPPNATLVFDIELLDVR
jgi:FKBP-type peptidyl-prolyl cis-trans isomerase FkpA